ncbi:MAG: hypothetical protein JM58_18145 [Peptococcaceae bacterium BICA1-8]|nr:MAG: hypothetical protein JM58_18145 [Peptococcaceae bacterium BICA1-8]
MKRDTIVFGALAGLIGNIPKTIIAWLFHLLGYLEYTFIHIAAGYFVPAKFIDNPVALATGFIADYTNAAFFGIIMYLMLQKTGTDYAVVKGLSFGAFVYLVFYGAFMALDITRASLLTPLPNLLLFFPHIIYGAVTCWFIRRYSGLYNRI